MMDAVFIGHAVQHLIHLHLHSEDFFYKIELLGLPISQFALCSSPHHLFVIGRKVACS